MKKITIVDKKIFLEDEIEEIFEAKVKKIGTGGMILANKKYLNRDVYVLVRKK